MRTRLALLLIAFMLGCSSGSSSSDAGSNLDSGTPPSDAGSQDAGTSTDAGTPVDAGQSVDGGSMSDAGSCLNTCASDADCPRTACIRDSSGCLICAPPPSADGGTNCRSAPCRSSNDCCGGARCVPAGTPQCGACMVPQDQCTSQSGCGSGQVCVPMLVQGCSCIPGAMENQCVPDCTIGGCGSGLVCGSDHACRPQQCNAGYTCPVDTSCQPGSGDTHGCVPKACSSDVDCTATYCVNGTCQPSLGQCALPVP